ncbi:MAG: response regulator [Lachnospiraceae bacterium]|nr:response regulator [Lachnospiraceae bacterium]
MTEMEKLRILAVDDNSISLAAIEQELKKEYEVIPVNSGSRALQYLRREKPDLILLDIQMAQKDGIETLREIREMEKCKDIPVIMLTSKQDKSAVVETSKLGIYDYILKPFQGENLHNRIDRVLKK